MARLILNIFIQSSKSVPHMLNTISDRTFHDCEVAAHGFHFGYLVAPFFYHIAANLV